MWRTISLVCFGFFLVVSTYGRFSILEYWLSHLRECYILNKMLGDLGVAWVAHSLFCLIPQPAVRLFGCAQRCLWSLLSPREEEMEEVCLTPRPHCSSGAVSFSERNPDFQTDSSFSRGCFYHCLSSLQSVCRATHTSFLPPATPTCSVISACLSWESISIFL